MVSRRPWPSKCSRVHALDPLGNFTIRPVASEDARHAYRSGQTRLEGLFATTSNSLELHKITKQIFPSRSGNLTSIIFTFSAFSVCHVARWSTESFPRTQSLKKFHGKRDSQCEIPKNVSYFSCKYDARWNRIKSVELKNSSALWKFPKVFPVSRPYNIHATRCSRRQVSTLSKRLGDSWPF